jgi:hypothetical protein
LELPLECECVGDRTSILPGRARHETQESCSIIALLERGQNIAAAIRRQTANRLAAVPEFRGDEVAAIQRVALEAIGRTNSATLDPMPRKPAPKPDNPEQYKRFLETAREVGADRLGQEFDRVLQKVSEPSPREPRVSKPRRSK